jgi:hypothetical protein
LVAVQAQETHQPNLPNAVDQADRVTTAGDPTAVKVEH